MDVQKFLKRVVQDSETNFFVVCPDNLGLLSLLQGVLVSVANAEDIHSVPASALVKERVQQLEKDAHLGPRGSSERTHFFIYGMKDLPVESAGPLLKTVEESKFARFIFQTQAPRRKLSTIRSRCQIVQLPFLTKRVVLGTMKARDKDALTADRLGLYDGTLDGTEKALGVKDTVADIRRELKKGFRGLVTLLSDEMINSLVFRQVVWPEMTDSEREFLERWDNPSRRRLVAFLVSRRQR